MKKAIALALAAAMSAGLLAGCGGAASEATSEAASTGDAASSEASAPAEAVGATVNTTDPISLSISWWGGDSRHAAYQEAIAAFSEKYPNITVEPTYGAWSGWEEAKSTALAASQGEDVMQVNWNWLEQYSGEGQSFVDLNQYSDIIDLSQFPESTLEACTVAGELQAIPVAMTGRTFFWNKATFDAAGVAIPTTYDELIAAGKAFQEKLGDDYYPLCVGPYDRMIMMTFWLESNYGKAWVEDGACNYTVEEIVEGLNFIQSLEDNHVIPNMESYYGAGFDSIDKSTQWIDGKYAGIFEWDSSANKYHDALPEDQQDAFTVGQEIKWGDKANGGFAKVSMGLAITESCKNPAEAAALINFLLNEEEGASIMGTECGMVTSASGQAAAVAAGKVKPLVKEANDIVMNFVDFQLDPDYESSKLKGSDGVYTDVFDGFSYGDYDVEEAAEILLDGVTDVLNAA